MSAKKQTADYALELRAACEIIERAASEDCTIIFGNRLVDIAPHAWSDVVSAPDLYEALTEAQKASKE
jgi:hypothetical protein